MGRSSSYTDEIAEKICEQIALGIPLREICRKPGMPAWRTVYDWIQDNESFAARIERARAIGADAIAEETMAIVDTKPERTSTEYGDKVDAGHVQWLKNRAEQRLKLLAKWHPHKYGEKIGVEHSGSVELAGALEAARKRVNGDDLT